MFLCLKLSGAPTLPNQFTTEKQNGVSALPLYVLLSFLFMYIWNRTAAKPNAWLSVIEERTDPPCCCRRPSDAFNKKRCTSRRRPPTRRTQVREPQCFLQTRFICKGYLIYPVSSSMQCSPNVAMVHPSTIPGPLSQNKISLPCL